MTAHSSILMLCSLVVSSLHCTAAFQVQHGRSQALATTALHSSRRQCTLRTTRAAVSRRYCRRHQDTPSGPCIASRKTSLQMTDSTSSSSSSSSEFDADPFAAQQKELSQQQRQPTNHDETAMTADAFVTHQRRVFDEFSAYFASDQAVPATVEPVLADIANRILSSSVASQQLWSQQRANERGASKEEDIATPPIRILDVACGTGVLHPYLLQAAAADDNEIARRRLDIVGVDLSPNMIMKAQENVDQLLLQTQDSDTHLSIQLQVADILQYAVDGDESQKFHAVVMNACFGNFLEPRRVLQHVCDHLLRLGGTLAITHPLGAAFVATLHTASPETVPHLLPHSRDDLQELILGLPLELVEYVNESPAATISSDNSSSNTASSSSINSLYYASVRKVRHCALDCIIRLRGIVDTGYGRGGKKLGFPTANLPSSLFQNALAELETGVYFGWAVIEGDSTSDSKNTGRNMPHKAVVNIGYSPTFAGQENAEKIVEAHLILDEEMSEIIGDFYGETMRLQLDAFLRPEIKFASFPDLIAQITADVQDSKAALETELYQTMVDDAFLTDHTDVSWVGSSGGDDSASWEYQDVRQTLQLIRSGRNVKA